MNSGNVLDAWHAAGLWDALCLAVLLLSVAGGLMRGLVSELAALLAWAGALVFAYWAAPAVVQWLGAVQMVQTWGAQARYLAAFVLAFVVAMVVLGMLAGALRRSLAALGLGTIDSLLGGVFGVARALLLLWIATVVITSTPLQHGMWWRESPTAGWLVQTLRTVAPSLPAGVQHWLPQTLGSTRV